MLSPMSTGDAAGVTRTRWWTPGRADWQVAASFSIGSVCFAVGALPGYASLVGVRADNVTFAIGSVFFTLAALLQFLISIGVLRADERPRSGAHWRTRVRSVDRPEWWSGMVQFVGTILFNVSTFSALNASLDADQAKRLVWRPDMFGSIAFLVASVLAYAGVRRPWWSWNPRDLDWSVATLNMVGSIAFGVSAVAAKVVPGTTDLRSVALVNLGTFVGAVCFLAGAVLLIPDEQEHEVAPGSPDDARSSPGTT
jgi:hypothetical protein